MKNPEKTVAISASLEAKGALMNAFKRQEGAMDAMRWAGCQGGAMSSTPAALFSIYEKAQSDAIDDLNVKGKLIAIPLVQQVAVMKLMPLICKRHLLEAMALVTVPIGAAVLGVTESDLHNVNMHNSGVFGDIYMGCHCNSMEELMLIAQNLSWVSYAASTSTTSVSSINFFDHVTFVDIDVAMAYTDMSRNELKVHSTATKRDERNMPTYRIADLEKIRTAKLAASLT